MNKEVNDALHTLLSMALENEKYTTQKEQYDIVHKEIERLAYVNNTKDIEIEILNNIINECAKDILKELKENHHLSYGVAFSIRQKLLGYKELNGSDKE